MMSSYCSIVYNMLPMTQDQMVTSLAALALYDGDAEVSAEQINTLLTATNNTVAPYWPSMFASFLTAEKIEELVFSGGAAASAAGPVAAAGGDDAPAAAAPAEKPKEEEVDALEGGMVRYYAWLSIFYVDFGYDVVYVYVGYVRRRWQRLLKKTSILYLDFTI